MVKKQSPTVINNAINHKGVDNAVLLIPHRAAACVDFAQTCDISLQHKIIKLQADIARILLLPPGFIGL